jgi:hypothetical protein
MSDKLPSAELVLTQSIAKAQMCQDIFRCILDDRTMTRIEILDYILAESEALTLLCQQLVIAIEQEQAAKFEERSKIIAEAKKSGQLTETEQVTDPEFPDATE